MSSDFSYSDVFARILSKNRWETERELAQALGISPNAWTAYKKGIRSFGLNDIARICDILQVDSKWLLFGETFTEAKQLIARLPAEDDIDREQLAIAIETIEEGLRRANKYPSPIKKAELIQIAYGIIRDDQDMNKIIRLVSAA